MTEDIFRARMRQRRRALGWSQRRVAEEMTKLGHAWHQTMVNKVEAGRRPIGLGEAVALGRILGADLSDMTSEGVHDPEAELFELRQRELAILEARFAELRGRHAAAMEQERAADEMAIAAAQARHQARHLVADIEREMIELQSRLDQVDQWLSRSIHPSQPAARRIDNLRSGPD